MLWCQGRLHQATRPARLRSWPRATYSRGLRQVLTCTGAGCHCQGGGHVGRQKGFMGRAISQPQHGFCRLPVALRSVSQGTEGPGEPVS